MAWVERTSGQHWRVRYRRTDGTIASEGGFTTPTTACIRAREIEVDQHRGTRAFRIHHEMLWATPKEVLRGAQQAERFFNRTSALLIITATWTGCRWGELAALQRHNTHPMTAPSSSRRNANHAASRDRSIE